MKARNLCIALKLIISISVCSASGLPKQENDSEPQRKILYLHVGPQKTGSTSIQEALIQNKERLLEAGYFYPIISGQHGAKDHWALQIMIDQGRMTDLFSTIQKVALDAGDANAIVLSSEQFSAGAFQRNPNYIAFLNYLGSTFDLRIIYCIRDRAKKMASSLCFSALYLTRDLLKIGSSEQYVKAMEEDENILFYAGFNANFFIFEELAAENKFVSNFFRKALNLPVSVDEVRVNEMGAMTGIIKLDSELLSGLEGFFSVAKSELSDCYNPVDDPKYTRLIRKIHELGLAVANKREERNRKALGGISTSEYITLHSELRTTYEEKGYQGIVLDHIVNAYRAVHDNLRE